MSRVAKWKIEKAKVKVVFRLQFHATNIPQHGWEKLFISFIPTETGKATAKTSKANVRGGSCKWADPIYETTRLLLDSKTKQYDDKLYKLVVGMGTSRSSILGEATINLADYADASQPAILSLPLHGSDHGTLLHVTVQLLTAKTGFREFEQQRDKGLQSGNNVNKETEHSTAKSLSSELQIPDDLVNKAKTRMQLREETIIHGEYSDSQVTCDESSNASDCYYADKHDSPAEKSSGSEQAKLDNDVAVVYEENNRLRASLAAAESSISELKQELTTLQSHANEMGTETQKLAQELTMEVASGQELVKEVNFLKSECSKFKNDLQNLKDVKSTSKVTERKIEVNGVILVESQIREIQEKILIGESGLNNLQSDFEVLLRTVQDLKNKTFGVVPIQPLQELETTKAENENLVKKMDEMECYYESLVHELEENQKRILADCQNLKTEINDLSSVNNELQKRVTVSESALKRARLNYSIAVSQLQKDLDMLSFQVLSMFETNQTVIKEAFADTTQPSSKHLSNDLKTSLSLQENIYKKVEEELSEMCSANLQLNVYSKTLEETLFEASDHIRKMNEKLRTLNQSRDSLFQENGYYLAKCNDLDLQNRMLESDVGNLSNENFLLMEKITECEALLMDYRVFKGKYEVVSAEKMELQKLLEVEVSDKQNLQKEIKILTSEMDDAKMKFMNGLYQTVSKMEVQKPCFEKLQLQIDSVANMFQGSLESGERHVQNSEAMLKNLSSLELELQKISSDDKSFHEQIVSELKKENQELMVYVENKREELGRLQECLDAERGTVACLTSELESQRSELESFKLKLEASIAHNAEISKSNDVLLETTLANVNNEHALEVRELKDMLTKSKAEVEQLKELQTKLEDTESRLNGCLKNEAFYIEENRNLATELESLRLELQASVAKNAEILESKTMHALEASQLKEMLTKSKDEVGRYIEENRNLVTEVESLRLELQASVAEISESKTMHANEASQLKEMLTKSKEEVARYIEVNRNLVTEIDSLRSELHASVAKNAEVAESENEHAMKVGQLQEMLTKSTEEVARYVEENRNLAMKVESLGSELQSYVAKNAEIAESENEHALKVGQLKDMLTKSNEEVTRYIEENRNLATELESLRLELQASIAENAEVSESKIELALKASQLTEMLTKSNEEVARYIEEKKSLATEVESRNVKLEDYIAHAAETKPTEVNYKNALDVDDVLTFQEETEITLSVFKAKLEEQNEELITLQNQCDQLTNKLTEQKLKTEEFKNLSIYLKELKDSADVAHEKKEKDPEGPTESLRIAFIKEQYQTKIQELKQQLSVSKRHNEEMLFKLQDALDEVESRKRSEASQLRRIQELEAEGEVVVSDKPDYDRLQAELECAVLSLECCKEEKEKLAALLREREDEKSKLADELSLIREQISQKEEKGSVNLQEIQGVTDRTLENEENPLANDSKQLMVVNDQFRTQHLMSCMEQLDEELEKMKNDNAHLSLTNFDPGFQDLQRELAQLHQANEELSSIYPNFVDFRGNGNALERVLALEIELAEALRTKKKSSIQFQSSFLKQHSDEEAVFKSFRDINELIKDMLEIKGKYVNVENELKEMHDRYSQLSLQFAEVEGERQKLMMTLKSVRSSRNLLRLNRSPVAALGDQS
ncbi:putative transcription factor bZIP family [Helianthus annuus]|nr:putative transcription factor bZIP family [Helianthus annuus]